MHRYRLRRAKMVEDLHAAGIRDKRVLAAMNKVPRHLFVEEALESIAYSMSALPLAAGQTISHPLTVARMTEMLKLTGSERVLEIGTGSGYQTAVLSELCEKVFSVECIRELLSAAWRCFDKLGAYNILAKFGDGNHGWPEKAPYDAIIVTAGARRVPEKLAKQLREGGKLIIPVGGDRQHVLLQQKSKDGLVTLTRFACKFVELVEGRARF